MQYRGRFAPSPTGPLHFGSLIAAVGSYLQARSQQGTWLVRIEDLDPPREIPGATSSILTALEAYGLLWDEDVTYQSTRISLYADAIHQLTSAKHTYPCTCSRKDIQESHQNQNLSQQSNSTNNESKSNAIYPRTCRSTPANTNKPHAIRLKTDNQPISFEDKIQGRFEQRLERKVGDFVILRSDGLFSYQIAVVVDDAEQKITEVVRGSDLLNNTPRQLYLQQLLNLETPNYIHLPIVVNQQGEKLSKQTFAEALDLTNPVATLWRTLDFLGQQPPDELQEADLSSFWGWAIQHWDTEKISRVPSIQEQ
ncbi:MAG: tRNA glutamyl-Q(34) synthetase GluQRS [Gammaproteobacteria bacterium]|nr:tRNA glutamyl-Q(34) synthetase GluQRS [Gammaproteobacteria bacterium]